VTTYYRPGLGGPRRDAASFRKKLDRLHSTDVDRVADVIVSVGKGQFTNAAATAWLLDSPDGQALMKHLSEKENAHG
jgi:hypothetical protein